MSAMDKMWLSLVAMLIMGLSVFLITFARAKTKGFVRGILSLIAFLVMLIGFIGGMAALI